MLQRIVHYEQIPVLPKTKTRSTICLFSETYALRKKNTPKHPHAKGLSVIWLGEDSDREFMSTVHQTKQYTDD